MRSCIVDTRKYTNMSSQSEFAPVDRRHPIIVRPAMPEKSKVRRLVSEPVDLLPKSDPAGMGDARRDILSREAGVATIPLPLGSVIHCLDVSSNVSPRRRWNHDCA